MRLTRMIPAAIVVGVLALYYNNRHRTDQEQILETEQQALPEQETSSSPATPSFRCEGKTHCSQMSSCEEATFYLRNCPGTKMDGDGDGIPCESQYCSG